MRKELKNIFSLGSEHVFALLKVSLVAGAWITNVSIVCVLGLESMREVRKKQEKIKE